MTTNDKLAETIMEAANSDCPDGGLKGCYGCCMKLIKDLEALTR